MHMCMHVCVPMHTHKHVCTGVWEEGALVCKLYRGTVHGQCLTTGTAAGDEWAAGRRRLTHDCVTEKIMSNIFELIFE